MEAELTTKNVLNILTCGYSNTDRQELFDLEKLNKIPLAKRKKSGKIERRFWSMGDLPKIAKYFGYLKKPEKQIIISTYAPKGGVLKTTLSFNLARGLALQGIRVLLIGLDSQKSLTSLCEVDQRITDISEYKVKKEYSLYDYFEKQTPIQDIIKKTDLEFLDYIPESDDLDRLSLVFGTVRKAEFKIAESLVPELSLYDVIIFDNPPSYTPLSISSIIASDVLITPLGCEIEAFKAVDNSINKVMEGVKKDVKPTFKNIYVSTKLDNTTLSKQIFYEYQNRFKGLIVSAAIRNSISGQEASYANKSIMEYKTDSPLATDYHSVIKELWLKVLA